jgi:MFS family permease
MTVTGVSSDSPSRFKSKSKLTRAQIIGFSAGWVGWILDGMDSFIYALVLLPALQELLPQSGYVSTPETLGFAGSILFALFLVGWGMAFVWGPIADRFGRKRTLAATIIFYSVFTALTAISQNVWEVGVYRFLAGVGIGGEWAIAGTYIAEKLPEDRREFAGGLLNAGYFMGFFLASALNYTVGATYGWRAMFLCGLAPVLIGLLTLSVVEETDRWDRVTNKVRNPLSAIFYAPYLKRTVVMTTLLACSIVGMWGASVYTPTAIRILARNEGMSASEVTQVASVAAALISLAGIVGNLILPFLATRIGRRKTLAIYYLSTLTCIVLGFGWAFYLPHGLTPFVIIACFLTCFAGGQFAIYNIWIPELYETKVRATAFSVAISMGRFLAAAVNFVLAAMIRDMGTLGGPIALTAVAFAIGLLVLPFSTETKGQRLPD